MLILRIAIRNLLRHPIKTGLIGSLIAAGVGFLFCANAVFEGTSRGLETSFIGSLTGDFVVGARTEETFGLFGSEVPIVSEYESIPAIGAFKDVSDILDSEAKVRSWTPIVSAAAQVNIGGYITNSPIFGVDVASYFTFCSDLVVEEGNITALRNGGVFLNSTLAKITETAIGRPLVPGEPIIFSMFKNGSFRARRGIFAGVYRYPAPTEVLDRVVLADPTIVRSLCDYTMGYTEVSKNSAAESPVAELKNLDDLFSEAEDISTTQKKELSLSDVEATLADTAKRDMFVMTNAADWSFVLVRAYPQANAEVARRALDRKLQRNRMETRVMDWRTAAGSSALMLFAVRGAFNVGVGFLILGATLIVMNALVISVLERTNEIGSMRALGASRGFIRSLFVLETMLLTIISAAVGIALGSVAALVLARNGIPLTNPLLVSLFGGTVVRPVVEAKALLIHLIGTAIIGSLAWIYPVSIALKIEPVSAMAER